MAIHFSSTAWKDFSFNSPIDKLVYLCLCDYSNEAGESWPSVPTIASACCLSERAVQFALYRLQSQGKISIQKGGGRSKSSHYFITRKGEPDTVNEIRCIRNGVSDDIKGESDDIKGERGSPDPYISNITTNITVSDTQSSADTSSGASAQKRKVFVRPSMDELRDYCQPRGIDPEEFFDYYEARDWKFKGGSPMRDWKSTVRTWERNEKKKQNGEDIFSKHSAKNANSSTKGNVGSENGGSVSASLTQW